MGICGSDQSKPEDRYTDITKPSNNHDKPSNNHDNHERDEDGSDFLFFIEMENDSDEVELDPVEDGYPEVKPTDDAVFDKDVYDENHNKLFNQDQYDLHARYAPSTITNSFEELIAYLESPFKDHQDRDQLLVRAILVWLSNQNMAKDASKQQNDPESPAWYLSLLRQKKTTYSTIFTVLCRKGNICCAQIHGISKAGDYQPGDTDATKLRCLWNAVYIQDKWRIVHPFWACCSVFGKVSGGWIKIEEGGKTVATRTIESAGTLQNAFQDYYIMPNPQEYVYACHPDDNQWQLVSKPINRSVFLKRAYLLPPFWGFDMELISDDQCSLHSRNGEANISFKTNNLKEANALDIWYQILLKENTSGDQTDILNAENIPKLVSVVRNTPEWYCKIQFPVTGAYKIVFFAGKHKQQLFRIAEFQLVCNKIGLHFQALPFNPGRKGIGPGPALTEAGLLLPSHKNGLVTADRNKPTNIRFFLDSDIASKLVVKTDLITKDSIGNEELQKTLNDLVECGIERSGAKQNLQVSAKELSIKADVPKKGDYYLRISTGMRRKPDDDIQDDDLTVVCNYHLKHSEEKTHEYGTKRFARRNLLAAIEGDSIEEIEKCLLQCEKAKIKPDHPDIEYAKRKLEVLNMRKAIHDAKWRRHLKTTEQTIQRIQNSSCERIFRRDVQVLKRLAENLRSLNGFTQELPRLLEALLELYNMNIPNHVVQNVLTALLHLFGTDVNPEWDYEDIRILSRRLYGRVLSQKETSLKEKDAKRAKIAIDNYTLEETQNSTLAATKMYKWINDVTKTVLQESVQ